MDLDRAFSALADPTRRALLVHLETGEQTLSSLASPLPITLMAVQKHVRVLEEAGLVATRKLGRSRHVRLRAHGLDRASDWIKQSETRWNQAFDRLEQALEEEDREQERKNTGADDT
jgi:DNA-binding transcriptional ArsR family regulator